jgi:hypothetical protein
MNKQELINSVKAWGAWCTDHNTGEKDRYVKIDKVRELIEQLDEKQKVTVPKFVAIWIKQCKEKATLADCLDGYYEISNGEGVGSEDFQNWVVDNENDELTAKAWIFGYEVEKPPVFPLSQGDLVIRKGKHEAKIYIVESVSESGVLLVNGIKDEFYSVDDEGGPDNDLDYFYSNFRLLAKKESLEVEEVK